VVKFLSAIILLSAVSAIAADSPPVELTRRTENGQLYLRARNASGKPIIAYVIAIKSDGGASTHVEYGVYTNGDSLAPGGTVDVGPVKIQANAVPPVVVLDYVRLADGSSWGERSTAQAKEIAARFEK
jgi:hypothetical protein